MTGVLALVSDELAKPVDPRVTALARSVAARHPGALAVLFYGSCLRETRLDGLMLDFYLIVENYRAAYRERWAARANAALPPNVYPFEEGGLIAKYAVLSADDLARETGEAARDASTFARFAQPARLVWANDAAARVNVVQSVAQAAPTLLRLAAPLVLKSGAGLEAWREAFRRTFAAELRAERGGRPEAIVDADPQRYARFAAVIRADDPAAFAPADKKRRTALERRWAQLRRRGKRRQVLKLAKASLTFAGGIDYLAWKINRHAGAGIVISEWQRRHPLLAAVGLVPRLLRRGAIR